MSTAKACRRYGLNSASFHQFKPKCCGMIVVDIDCFKPLVNLNTKSKRNRFIPHTKAFPGDLPPKAPSFITRVCGFGFHNLWFQFGQARRTRSLQIAQAFGAPQRVSCFPMTPHCTKRYRSSLVWRCQFFPSRSFGTTLSNIVYASKRFSLAFSSVIARSFAASDTFIPPYWDLNL